MHTGILPPIELDLYREISAPIYKPARPEDLGIAGKTIIVIIAINGRHRFSSAASWRYVAI